MNEGRLLKNVGYKMFAKVTTDHREVKCSNHHSSKNKGDSGIKVNLSITQVPFRSALAQNTDGPPPALSLLVYCSGTVLWFVITFTCSSFITTSIPACTDDVGLLH